MRASGCLKKITRIDRKFNLGEIDNVTIEELMSLTPTISILATINERCEKFLGHVNVLRHGTTVRRPIPK